MERIGNAGQAERGSVTGLARAALSRIAVLAYPRGMTLLRFAIVDSEGKALTDRDTGEQFIFSDKRGGRGLRYAGQAVAA